MQIDLGNLTAPPLPVLSLNQGAEFVASSQQGHTTLKGYTVETSAGSSFGGIQSTTLSGYKVYTSLQGEIISQNQDIVIADQAAARR